MLNGTTRSILPWASNPQIGDPFRATVKQARRRQVAAVIERGIERGDLHRTSHASTVAEILVGPIYYRLIFGGPLDRQFAEDIVSTFLEGHSNAAAEHNHGT